MFLRSLPRLAFRQDCITVSEEVHEEVSALPARAYLVTDHKVGAGLQCKDCGGQKKQDPVSSSPGKKKPCAHHLGQSPIHTVARLLTGTGDESISCHFESRTEMPAQSCHPQGKRLGWALTLRWSSSALLEDESGQRRDARKHFSFALPC